MTREPGARPAGRRTAVTARSFLRAALARWPALGLFLACACPPASDAAGPGPAPRAPAAPAEASLARVVPVAATPSRTPSSSAPGPEPAAVDAAGAGASTAVGAGTADAGAGEAAAAPLTGRGVPGACVDPADFVATVLNREAPGGPGARSLYQALPFADLDGDGTPDTLVAGGGVRAQRIYHLFVRRNGCAYYVGTIPGAEEVTAAPAKSNGLRDVQTRSDECPRSHRMHYCSAVWSFDGTRYVARSEKALDRVKPPPEVGPDLGP